jgi:hypothetical protein
MSAKMIEHEELIAKYEPVNPVNGYLLVEVTDKPSEYKLKSGIIMKQTVENNDRPYLIVARMSPEASTNYPSLKTGDIIEVVEVNKISMFHGPAMEQFGLVHSSHIAAIYSIKKEFSEDSKVLKEILNTAKPDSESYDDIVEGAAKA